MSPLPRQGWLFLIEFLKWYFSKYWQVRTRPVFAQTVTYIHKRQAEPITMEDESLLWELGLLDTIPHQLFCCIHLCTWLGYTLL